LRQRALITGAADRQRTAEAELFVREAAAIVVTGIAAAAAGDALAGRLGAANRPSVRKTPPWRSRRLQPRAGSDRRRAFRIMADIGDR
jgi:hypothetical protein